MGLKAKHGWVKGDEYHVKNSIASICKNTVNGEDVYILWPNMRAKPGHRICLGPFPTAEAAEAEYEKFVGATATIKGGDFSQGSTAPPHNEGMSV